MSRQRQSISELREGIRLAIGGVRVNKFRSIMTILGVTIGVGAVIIVNTIMDGFNSYAEASIDKIGSEVMYIRKWAMDTDYENLTEQERKRKDITMEEALAIQEMCPLVKAVSPQKKHWNNIAQYRERKARNPDDLRGCWPEEAIVANREVVYGRFIDDNDLRRAARVCVIGPDIADALFAERADAIGKEIKVNGDKFKVIGVQEKIDDLFNISENDYILMPMTTFDQLYPRVERIYLVVSAISRQRFAEALDQVTNALRRVRGLRSEEENNFDITTQESFKGVVSDITRTVQLGATAVACVGLLVGMIGVMNIMLVAVTLRTREIGIRKAVGARKSNILFQFVVEAATLTGLGGIVGIIIGGLAGLGITAALEWQYQLSPLWVGISLVMSIGTGMIAGIYPAWRAARVDPIVALQYE